MELEQSIQDELRQQAESGASVTDLIRLIRERCGVNSPGKGRLLVLAYLTRTFGIPLSQAAEIGGWVGFGDGDGTTTDDELQDLLGNYLRLS